MIIDINDRYFKSACPEFILNEFNKATEYETNELCFMYIKQFRLEKLVNKKTFINLYTKEGRNLEFLKFLGIQNFRWFLLLFRWLLFDSQQKLTVNRHLKIWKTDCVW